VQSARVATRTVPDELCQPASVAGDRYSLLPCTGQRNPALYLAVVATSLSQLKPVEADIRNRAGVLAVDDSRSVLQAKLDGYRSWRDLGVGASVVIIAFIAVVILRRPRWPAPAP
jgi:hypothetical protein